MIPKREGIICPASYGKLPILVPEISAFYNLAVLYGVQHYDLIDNVLSSNLFQVKG